MCGTDQKQQDGVLLTGIHIEFEGDIEVCVSCIQDAAGMVGYVPAARVTECEEEIDTLRQYADEVYEEVCAKQAAIETLAAALAATAADRDAQKEAVSA